MKSRLPNSYNYINGWVSVCEKPPCMSQWHCLNWNFKKKRDLFTSVKLWVLALLSYTVYFMQKGKIYWTPISSERSILSFDVCFVLRGRWLCGDKWLIEPHSLTCWVMKLQSPATCIGFVGALSLSFHHSWAVTMAFQYSWCKDCKLQIHTSTMTTRWESYNYIVPPDVLRSI